MKARTRETQAAAAPQSLEMRTYTHTLSLRLTGEQYRRLRRFVTGHEDRTGQRITHQAVLEAALTDYLDRSARLSNSTSWLEARREDRGPVAIEWPRGRPDWDQTARAGGELDGAIGAAVPKGDGLRLTGTRRLGRGDRGG